MTADLPVPALLESSPAPRQSALRVYLPAFLASIYLLLIYVLPPPLPVRPSAYQLDDSWHIILTKAFLGGVQFGRDLVYTYGPWGFLQIAQGDPRIYPWLVGGRLLIAAAFVTSATFLARRGISNTLVRILFVAWVALLGDPVLLLPVLLLAVVLSAKRNSPLLHLMAIACGLTMLIKFTGFVSVGALLAAMAFEDLRHRRLPVIPSEILGSALAFWLLAGQSVIGVPAFVHGALSTAASYSPEMFVAGPSWEIVLAVILLAAIAMRGITSYISSDLWPPWPFCGWLALFFFLHTKEALVRHDSFHIWMGVVTALLPGALVFLCMFNVADTPLSLQPVLRLLKDLSLTWIVFMAVAFPLIQLGTDAGRERLQAAGDSFTAYRAMLAGESLSSQYQNQVAGFRRFMPLTKVPGTASFFPDFTSLLYANGLSVRLPPIPQAFAAYNSYLSGRNASFYRSATRPDFVFFDVLPIDGRYPTSSDPLSWMAFLDCYVPAGYPSVYLVLRSNGCHGVRTELISESVGQAGRPIAVPSASDSAIWVQFDLSPNLAGRMIATLARPPLTQLSVRTPKGESMFRISPEAARTGFLLSPLITTPASFERLFTDSVTDPAAQVKELKVIESSAGEKLFEPTIRFRFFRLPLPASRRLPEGSIAAAVWRPDLAH